VKLLPYGPRAVLAEFSSLTEVLAADAAWSALPGVSELVPAARTVLVVHDADFDRALLAAPVAAATPDTLPHTEPIVVPVHYDGDDLTDVAVAAGLSVAEVIALHSGAEYRVAFCGFMPGFSYLVGLHPKLQLPRRATPRTRVPAGSVAIADAFTGVYPRQSPGGWHRLGHTDLAMWDDRRTPAATLPPGAAVRFVPA
jgi:KipI family sensor histidine kinase inhibitor